MGKAEKKIENYLQEKAKAYGFLCYKFTSPGQAGVPDRIIIGDGIVSFVELKTEKGRVSKQQLLIIDKIKKEKVPAFICKSEKEIDEFFKKIYNKK